MVLLIFVDCSDVGNMMEKRVLSEESRNQRMFFMLKKNSIQKDVNRRHAFSPENRYNPNALTKAISNHLDIPDSKRFVINAEEEDGAIARAFSQGAKNANSKLTRDQSTISEVSSVKRRKPTFRKVKVRNLGIWR